jgi:hypothetical protein
MMAVQITEEIARKWRLKTPVSFIYIKKMEGLVAARNYGIRTQTTANIQTLTWMIKH